MAPSPDLPPPEITDELLEYLSRTYPLRPPMPSVSSRLIWMEAGRQDLIQRLRNIRARADEEASRR